MVRQSDLGIRVIPYSGHPFSQEWALEEYGVDGLAQSEALLPWQWGVRFRTENLHLSTQFEQGNPYTVGIEPFSLPAEDDEAETVSVRETICGDLFAIDNRNKSLELSMLGSLKEVSTIELNICTPPPQVREGCYFWWHKGYTDEGQHYDDYLLVSIYLDEHTFRSMRDVVASQSVEALIIDTVGVTGLYAPSNSSGIIIGRQLIKVLAQDKEQIVEDPLSVRVQPPRLERVHSFKLNAKSRQNCLRS